MRHAERILFVVSVILFAAWLGLISAQAGMNPAAPDDRAQVSTPTASPTLPLPPSATQPPFDGIFATATPTRTPTPINIGNFVWDDLDGDGIQDAGEPGMSGITVRLWNSAKNTILDTDVTNASGNYTVIAPLPGEYRVQVVLPGGMDQFSPKEAGSDVTKDSDINPTGVNLGFTDIISIASNVISIISIDAGIIRFRTPTPTRTPTPINIGNFVWDDLDGDGIQDAGEPGIEGVTVQLWNPDRTLMIDETVTNASGNYTVIAPVPGEYRVRVIKPSSADDFSPKNAGSDISKDSNINPTGTFAGYTDIISIASNVISIVSIDAGIITADPVTIGDRVWHDTDGDGLQDPARLEPGIAGRLIRLRVDSFIDYTVASTFTDATGRYSVTAPEAGTYYLCVVMQSGETLTIKDASDGNPFTLDDLSDNDANPSGVRIGCTDNFTVSASTTIFDIGFLNARASIVGSVTLQGHGTAPNALWSQPHRVRVVSTSTSSVVFDGTVTSTTSGQLIVAGIPTGSYIIWVKGEHTLASSVTRALDQGNNVFSIGTMREGDANGDNVININDFSILAATFGKSDGQAGYDDRADFSDNGVVDLTDFTLQAANFGQAGAAMP